MDGLYDLHKKYQSLKTQKENREKCKKKQEMGEQPKKRNETKQNKTKMGVLGLKDQKRSLINVCGLFIVGVSYSQRHH